MKKLEARPQPRLLSAACTLLVGSLVLASAVSAQTPLDKEQLHARMAELQREIGEQRALAGSAAESVRALRDELAAISASLGGDLPCAVGEAAAGASEPLGVTPLPTGCMPISSSASNTTAVPISDGAPSVVTSTIEVSGAAPYLWELTVTTFIRHTFAADLDITLQSPSGTVVTLTTDNGAGNDDVFNGTVWSDRANPGGQVPYTTNAGLVTDHPYTNLVLASPLVPEESLAAFAGENPNGTWTLTISDDLTGDGGSLDQWSLDLVGFAQPPIVSPPQSFTNNTPLAIPTGPEVVSSTLEVSGLEHPICGVSLNTALQHTFAADLDITLQSPSGSVMTLTTDNGAGNDNVFDGTLWIDTANPGGQVPYTTNQGLVTDHAYTNLVTATPLVPEESFGLFRGENGNGTWTLTISDDLAGDGGSLNSWSLNLITCTCAQPADVALGLSAAPSSVDAGGEVVFTAVATNNGPGVAQDVVINFPLPAGFSFVSSSASAGGSCAGTSPVVCTWPGALANAASHTATIRLRAPATAGSFPVNATVSTASTDPTPANNSAAVTLGVNQPIVRPAVVPAHGPAGLALLALLLGLFGLAALRRMR